MTIADSVIEAQHIPNDLPLGDLASREWEKPAPVQIERYWSGQPAPQSRHATARILWSKKALYVRFVCRQGEPLVINDKPRSDKKTIGLWDRDVCEIFIAPDPNVVERYFEFEAAPTGEWLDVAIHWTAEKRESDWDFNSQMTASGHPTADRVTIAMRIPWNHWIHEPQKGERWRANLFRCVGAGASRGYLAWQPTRTAEANFHVPQVFGWLVFR